MNSEREHVPNFIGKNYNQNKGVNRQKKKTNLVFFVLPSLFLGGVGLIIPCSWPLCIHQLLAMPQCNPPWQTVPWVDSRSDDTTDLTEEDEMYGGLKRETTLSYGISNKFVLSSAMSHGDPTHSPFVLLCLWVYLVFSSLGVDGHWNDTFCHCFVTGSVILVGLR